LAEIVEDYGWAKEFPGANFRFAREKTPLGTGGAVQAIFRQYSLKNAWVINGDTLLPQSLPEPSSGCRGFYAVLEPDAIFDATPNVKVEGSLVRAVESNGQYFDAGAVYLTAEALNDSSCALPFSIHELLKPSMQKGLVTYARLPGTCYDIGTPERYRRFENHLNGSRAEGSATKGLVPILLIFALLFASVGWHWKDKVLSSHMFRQAHTAQNAEMYNLIGWNPLRAYYRFIHKPGMNLLELPIYQSLNAGLSRLSALSIDQSGRLLNVVFGLLYALGLVTLFRRLNGSESPVRTKDFQRFALIFSIPLLFAISQWVLVDLFACTAATWALILFTIATPAAAVGQALLLALAFAVKPPVFVATLPFYLLSMWDNKRLRLKPYFRLASTTVAILTGLAWFWYGQKLNVLLGGQFKITDSGYYIGSYALNPIWIGKLLARIVIYVLGPGTVVLLAIAFLRDRASLKSLNRPLALACAASFVFFALGFLNLNVRHNYYQLPLLIPVAPWLFGVIDRLSARVPAWPIVLSLAIVVNVATAERKLLRADRDLEAAVESLKHTVEPGLDRPEISVFDNIEGSGPMWAYYLGRYSYEYPLEKFASSPRADGWFAACDLWQGEDCRKQIVTQVTQCEENGRAFGRYWICASGARL
jgi:hypothetical protein